MASAPSDPRPILGRVDASGRLVAADPELERLQVEAGSSLGSSLALPQLAAIVRIAKRLGIPLSRRVIAAGRGQDVDMWVRAVPEDEDVVLTIERWTARPASQPRLAAMSAVEHESLVAEPLGWSVDDHLRLLEIAPPLAELLSCDAADAAGEPLTKYFRLEEGEDGEMPLLDALVSRGGFEGQRVSARDSGRQFLLNGSVVLAADGAFAGFEGTAVVDGDSGAESGRPALDGAIQTALRSPLDRIVQSAEEMRSAADSSVGERYTAYAADIATAARHLLSVVRSLGENGESAADGQVDLAELASEAVALVDSQAQERSIIIGVQPIECLFARGQARSVVQILVNLIGNAVRYSPPQTTVTVSFAQSQESAMVHVADEGAGIDACDHERIFEAFQKGSEEGEGSGLGLAIARRLARAMGGDIQLRSAPGEGSRFTLVLPVA